MTVGMPGDRGARRRRPAPTLERRRRRRPSIDLVAGGRVASLRGRWPRAAQDRGLSARSPGARSRWRRTPGGSATARSRSTGGRIALPLDDAAARHPRDRARSPLAASSTRRRSRPSSGRTGRSRGRAVQRFELDPDRLTCRLELHADEPMPASIGWHPWFVRRLAGRRRAQLELDLDAGAMYVRDAAGIATDDASRRRPGPWDDCFTDLRRPPVLRWPGFLELTIESDCPDWVVYTVPEDALCVEPQTAPPDALNTRPDGRRARPTARRRDDLALAVARRLSAQPPVGGRRGGRRPGSAPGPAAGPSGASTWAGGHLARRRPARAAATSLARSTTTSGVIPSCQIWRPFGVSHSTVPTRRAEPSDSGNSPRTVPVP